MSCSSKKYKKKYHTKCHTEIIHKKPIEYVHHKYRKKIFIHPPIIKHVYDNKKYYKKRHHYRKHHDYNNICDPCPPNYYPKCCDLFENCNHNHPFYGPCMCTRLCEPCPRPPIPCKKPIKCCRKQRNKTICGTSKLCTSSCSSSSCSSSDKPCRKPCKKPFKKPFKLICNTPCNKSCTSSSSCKKKCPKSCVKQVCCDDVYYKNDKIYGITYYNNNDLGHKQKCS